MRQRTWTQAEVLAVRRLRERYPFWGKLKLAVLLLREIQVDGGSEFMAEFEDACKEKRILLFCLPPRSPKLNGRVELVNRTYREEFYNCSEATPTAAGFRADLLNWEHTYNHIRPHQAATM